MTVIQTDVAIEHGRPDIGARTGIEFA